MSHALFDALQTHFKCTNDASLASHLGIVHSTATRYRHGTNAIGPGFILRLYDLTGWSIEHIRSLLANPTRNLSSERNDAKRAIAAKKRAATIAKKRSKQKPRVFGTEDTKAKRLTVTKTPQWVSTVHRVL